MSWVNSTRESSGICFSGRLFLVTFHRLALLHAFWSRGKSFWITEWSPLGGVFSFRTWVGVFNQGTNFVGEANPFVLPCIPGIGCFSCWLTPNMVCYVPGSSLLDRFVKFLLFCLVIYPAGWPQRGGIFSHGRKFFLDVLGIAPAHLGFFSGNWGSHGFLFPLWSSSWTWEGLFHSLSL